MIVYYIYQSIKNELKLNNQAMIQVPFKKYIQQKAKKASFCEPQFKK